MPSVTPANPPQELNPIGKALRVERPGLIAVAGSGGKTALVAALCRELAAAKRRVALSTTTHIYPPPARLCGPAWLWGGATPDSSEIKRRLEPGEVLAVARAVSPQGKLQGLDRGQMAALASSGAYVVAEADGAARKPLKAWAPHEPAWPGGESLRVVLVGAGGLGRPLSPETVHRPELFAGAAGLATGQTVTPAALTKVLLGPEGPLRDRPLGVALALVVNQVDAASPALVESLAAELKYRAGGWLRILMGSLRRGVLQEV